MFQSIIVQSYCNNKLIGFLIGLYFMIAMKKLFLEKFVINEIKKYQCQVNYMEPLCKGVKFKSREHLK